MEDVAIADAAFLAWGKSLNELFANCAKATFEVMVDTIGLLGREKKIIELENEKVDELLIDWLSELIFLKDRDQMLFKDFKIDISKGAKYKLMAEASGEKIDKDRHELRSDVKAVTYHLLEVIEHKRNWKAKVILDV